MKKINRMFKASDKFLAVVQTKKRKEIKNLATQNWRRKLREYDDAIWLASRLDDGDIFFYLCGLKDDDVKIAEILVSILEDKLTNYNAIFTAYQRFVVPQNIIDLLFKKLLEINRVELIRCMLTFNRGQEASAILSPIGKKVEEDFLLPLLAQYQYNVPSRGVIDNALQRFAHTVDMELFDLLCALPGENTPGIDEISDALLGSPWEAIMHAYSRYEIKREYLNDWAVVASRIPKLQELKILCVGNNINKPVYSGIPRAIAELSLQTDGKQLAILQMLLGVPVKTSEQNRRITLALAQRKWEPEVQKWIYQNYKFPQDILDTYFGFWVDNNLTKMFALFEISLLNRPSQNGLKAILETFTSEKTQADMILELKKFAQKNTDFQELFCSTLVQIPLHITLKMDMYENYPLDDRNRDILFAEIVKEDSQMVYRLLNEKSSCQKPSRNAVALYLKAMAIQGDLDIVKFLCSLTTPKLECQDIANAVSVYSVDPTINLWFYENYPLTVEKVRELLEDTVVQDNNAMLAKFLELRTNVSSDIMHSLLVKAGQKNNLEIYKTVCSFIDKGVLESLVSKLLSTTSLPWEIVNYTIREYLVAKNTIQTLIIKACDGGQLPFFEIILAKEAINEPDNDLVSVLIFQLNKSRNVAFINAICLLLIDHFPVAIVANKIATIPNLNLVQLKKVLSTYKIEQDTLSTILQSKIINHDINFVKMVLAEDVITKPTKNVILNCMKLALMKLSFVIADYLKTFKINGVALSIEDLTTFAERSDLWLDASIWLYENYTLSQGLVNNYFSRFIQSHLTQERIQEILNKNLTNTPDGKGLFLTLYEILDGKKGNEKIQLLFSFFDTETIINHSYPFRQVSMPKEQILWVHGHYQVAELTLITWIKKALEGKETYYKTLLKANCHNHISRPILNELLLEACRLNNKDFFNDLCCIKDLPPSAAEISNAIKAHPSDDICIVASKQYALDQHVFDFFAEKMINANKFNKAIELLQSIFNKPSKTGLLRLLRIAAQKDKSELFIQLHSRPTENPPSPTELSQILEQIPISDSFFLKIYPQVQLSEALVSKLLIKFVNSTEDKVLFQEIDAAHKNKPFSNNTITSLRRELEKNKPHCLDLLPFVKEEKLSPLRAGSMFKQTPARADSTNNQVLGTMLEILPEFQSGNVCI